MTLTPSITDPWMVSLQVQDRKLPLLILGGVHPTRVQDGWSSPSWKQVDGGWNVECRSTHWESARVSLREVGKAWEIGLTVKGKGNVDMVSFLEGALAERVPHPQNTMTMVGHNRLPPRHYGRATPVWHKRTFNPQPEARTGPWFDPLDPTRITVAATFWPRYLRHVFSRRASGVTRSIWAEGNGVLSLGLVTEPGAEHSTLRLSGRIALRALARIRWKTCRRWRIFHAPFAHRLERNRRVGR